MAIPFNSDFKVDQYNIAIDFGLLSVTPGDIYNWVDIFENYKIISKKSLKILSEEYPDLQNINTQSHLGHLTWKNEKIINHTYHGNTNNYECIIKGYPEEKLIIVILANLEAGDIHSLADKIHNKIEY